ncbi:hypothetical protein Lal_00031129 [Lupinus albus]|uniref:Uncharacterized protein n=1 Tax=Lupinus albus TaxID=3870 RepID=A0A6A5LYU3_LUPAL|nr:hypothetical protein Lalb_Chr17g0346141 [Lupinus albus]KAF1863985.1 hypothetical protein Lal_00031129 [Lupinus albus]
MALTTNKVSSGPIVTQRTILCRSHEKHYFPLSTRISRIQLPLFNDRFINRKAVRLISKKSSISCKPTGTNSTEEKECVATYDGAPDLTRVRTKDEKNDEIHNVRGLAEACRFIYNDAKFVNERARNDIVLLSRGLMRLDARARQDVAFLGTEFLKIDARAREDTEKIDRDVKDRAMHLSHIAAILKGQAQSRLKSAADEHWSDGALETDLRLADFRAKQRAMEDALMSMELIKYTHDRMVSKLYNFPLRKYRGSLSANNTSGYILNNTVGDVTTERISALQEAYWSMASALSEADGIDYTDPEELELLITTLIDLDAMDGKQSVSLLAECSSSPDVSTRRALANALAAAPSMWTLGNAGMGALQRLAEDSNPAISAAASKAIYELKKQWEIEEGDSWRFKVNVYPMEEKESREYDNEEDTK